MLRGSCLCGAGTYANVDRAGLHIERGEELITEYASSSHGRRAFCRQCGSTLFWRSEDTPDRIAVTLGTLDAPFLDPVDIELHTDTKPSWLPTQDPR